MTNYSQQGRGYVHVTYFCMCNCGLRKISPRCTVNWYQQSSLRRTYLSRTLDGRCYTL